MRAPTLLRGCLIATVVTGGALVGCGLEQSELQVRVLDAVTGGPIQGAAVTVSGYRRERTNMVGVARMFVRPGAYELEVSAMRYTPRAATVSVFTGMASTATISLEPAPSSPTPSTPPGPGPSPGASTSPSPKPGPSQAPPAQQGVTLYGKVVDPTGVRVPGATVFVESDFGVPFAQPAATNAVGEYRLHVRVPRGTPLRVSAMADRFHTKSRTITPRGEWRLDFAGAYALTPVVTSPDLPARIRVKGRIEDTMGRRLDWAVVKVEAEGVRHPYKEYTIARQGAYEIEVPTNLPLRFTASKTHHRTVTFTETVQRADARYDFTGYRALDPTPILEAE